MKKIKIVFILFFYVIVSVLSQDTLSIRKHKGDLYLQGSDNFVIENEKFHQTGNIFVRDNAKLIIKDATLYINQRYHEEFRIEVGGHAALEIQFSTVDVSIPGEGVEIHISDSAKIDIRNSDLLNEGRVGIYLPKVFNGRFNMRNTPIGGIMLLFKPNGRIKADVTNCMIWEFTFRFDDYFRGSFSNLVPGLHDSWKYQNDDFDINLTKIIMIPGN